ncbi:hypothetical protein SLEP1_g51435 [Rubroshorea leprosula]|uniref:Peptidase M3A/M3B catalytic domain-containing protein n=1 Tax=Rubroshorea leprosula TaxID=152421 RepID=A0AAV5M450_9ROSI|nr:hypothetical protein SLEP1_g51435 [Rubroshorea leprosula]
MDDHRIEISSNEEEGNREHASGTPSIMENEAGDSTSSKDSIFRIPGLFKIRNEEAYKPYKFSIGPWHVGKTQMLRSGQKLKESLLEKLINRFPDPAAKRSELKNTIKKERDKARDCYEGGCVDVEGKDINVAEEEFEEILLLDGCFIIELFRKHDELFSKDVEQVSIQETGFPDLLTGMIHVIYHDLLLLDNQIPWFVLELLFNETNEHLPRRNSTLVGLAGKFFRHVSSYEPQELQRLLSGHNSGIIHLVDFLWRFWNVSSEKGRIDFEFLDYGTLIPSVTRLKEVGVKFQKAESRNILNVKFKNGVLEIPPLTITPSTETIFRNLIIFEQCSLLCTPRVTSYAILLDCLVDTSDDVHLMNREGILENTLNPEETANFLNRVRDNALTQELFYARLRKDVNEYCEKSWPRWRASLIHNYFTKPWAIVSTWDLNCMGKFMAQILQEELRPYFSLPKIMDGLFNLANTFFGIVIEPADGLAPVWNKDVTEKKGGAWMDEVVSQSRVLSRNGSAVRLPIAHMVETVLHEFGHALQHMLTKQDEGLVSGIWGIEWDAVE